VSVNVIPISKKVGVSLLEIVASLLPLLGVVLGAALQHYFTREATKRESLMSLRTQAYIDYLSGTAEAATTGRDAETLAKVAESKARISVYGSGPVVKAIADFEKVGPVLDSDAGMESYLDIVDKMRAEAVIGSEDANAEDLKLLLFGQDRSGVNRSV
jgi:hypothetical protein